jgi:hypothetical protein
MLYHMKNHNSYLSGPADVWYSGNKGDIWVEYKFVAKLPRVVNLTDTKKKYALSALQQEWLRARWLEGRAVYVILGMEDGGILFREREWETEHEREELLPYVQSRVALAIWIYNETTKGSYEPPPKTSKRLERCV